MYRTQGGWFAGAIVLLVISVAHAGELFNENFNSYPDASELRLAGSPKWSRIGGTSNDLLISKPGSDGVASVNALGDDDVAGTLSSSVNTGHIYASFTLIAESANRTASISGTQSPISFYSSSGAYFGRVLPAVPGGTPGDSIRLGLANAGTASGTNGGVLGTINLAVDMPHTIVLRYDFTLNQSTLWINPATESDPSITATDAVTTTPNINRFALRQPNSDPMGDFSIDNLIVGTAFSDVISVEPITGDANADGKVDIADLKALGTHFYQAGTLATGDFSGNGYVDDVDLGILSRNWQFGVSGAAKVDLAAALASVDLANASVPEPTWFAGTILVLAAFLPRRQRGVSL